MNRQLLLIVLSCLSILSLSSSPTLVQKVHAVSTICQSVTNQMLYDPRNDFEISASYKTCGTLNASSTQFVSTTHNVTIICSVPYQYSLDCPAGSSDLQINSGVAVFLGQNDTVTKYNVNAPWVNGAAYQGDQIWSVATTENQTVDFAQTYWQFNITDSQSGGRSFCHTFGFCLYSRAQFVGTSNAFELDWADGNNDGVVNNTDLNNISAYYHKPDPYWDFDRDNNVTVTDIARVAIHGGKSFGILHYPGQGCVAKSVESSNETACPALYAFPAPNSLTQAPRQGWKGLCAIFPEPDKSYCNNLPG